MEEEEEDMERSGETVMNTANPAATVAATQKPNETVDSSSYARSDGDRFMASIASTSL